MHFSSYRISEETDDVLVLKEKISKKFTLCFLSLICAGAIYLPISTAKPNGNSEFNYWTDALLFSTPFVLVLVSTLFLITSASIRIDKRESKIYLVAGLRRLIGLTMVIPFSDVNYLRINSIQAPRGTAVADVIILKRYHAGEIQIDSSFDAKYVNELSWKMARHIGCEVYHESFGTYDYQGSKSN